MRETLADQYARELESLEGNAFQDEVCARFQSVIVDFQQIPPLPHGDGRLDGLSHDRQYGYCCYGPQHSTFKNNRERASAVVKKFTSDVRRLFELETKGRNLVHRANLELGTILPKGVRLRHITLVSNWFDDHRVLGPLGDAFAACKEASRCHYVEREVTWLIVGPKQLSAQYAVDESTITRVQQRSFVARVRAVADSLPLAPPADFDSKMGVLRQIVPQSQHAAVDRLEKNLRKNWSTALALELELSGSAPNMHFSLEHTRMQIATTVSQMMLATNEPWRELGRATEAADQLLRGEFGVLYGSLMPTVASGEVARLIGECEIDWRDVARV